ncbi:hypothetical protein JOB18_040377, partial [Solea senegalensis]
DLKTLQGGGEQNPLKKTSTTGLLKLRLVRDARSPEERDSDGANHGGETESGTQIIKR